MVTLCTGSHLGSNLPIRAWPDSWQAVRAGVFAHFDADPAPPHLVRHRRRGAGAEEGVEDEVAFVGGDVEDGRQQSLRFGSGEWRFAEQR